LIWTGKTDVKHPYYSGNVLKKVVTDSRYEREYLLRLETMYRILFFIAMMILIPLTGTAHEVDPHPSKASKVNVSSAFQFLRVGETAPDFTLINQDNKAVSFSDFRGKAVLLTFIYTNCPTSCPITTKKFVQIQKDMAGTVGSELILLAITVDPEVDTPEKLKEFALDLDVDLTTMHFLTGEADVVREVLKTYGIWSLKDDEGIIDHPAIAYMFDDFGILGEILFGFADEL
jgi:cytochrome oxidase Cu insertion factor (SCO1/SenC/PrrC family)